MMNSMIGESMELITHVIGTQSIFQAGVLSLEVHNTYRFTNQVVTVYFSSKFEIRNFIKLGVLFSDIAVLLSNFPGTSCMRFGYMINFLNERNPLLQLLYFDAIYL